MTVEIPICIPFLLHQKEGWEAMPGTRLLEIECTHHQKSLSITPNPRNH